MKTTDNRIIFENSRFALTVGTDCIARSLIYKPTGEELLYTDEDVALFSTTQKRPYNNEVKLSHPNKKTTFEGNSLRVENGKLIAGFETVPYEAVIGVKETDCYIEFVLEDFIVHRELYPSMMISLPPVDSFRILQLPIKNRARFGEWLNVISGDGVAVNVLATSQYTIIDSDRHKNYRTLYADCTREVKLMGVGGALIVADDTDEDNGLMHCIDTLERDYRLPLGVESRKRPQINRSIYWTSNINADNLEKHIKYAKQGGFSSMMLYIVGLQDGGYEKCGKYKLARRYTENDTLKKMLARLKEEGITPGLHFLQTFIGRDTEYVTPHADDRLGIREHFTLSASLDNADSGDIFVNESPEGVTMADGTRILKFGTELIGYDGYTTERPFRFYGIKRGEWSTEPIAHSKGEIGGVLDVCEFGAVSCYIDQKTDLQDEVAKNIAKVYDLGFEFVYFDGSEGVGAPFEFNVPNAQYRVLKALNTQPLFTMGAAKAHFGWHFLSGGNAFDVFPPEIFKAMIDKYPAEEAVRMAADYTVVNFGWWCFFMCDRNAGAVGTQPDIAEYGTSHAAAYGCPVTLMENLSAFESHPRFDDIFEVLRRWEDVRRRDLLTDEQKNVLKVAGDEYTLIDNGNGGYRVAKCRQLKDIAGGNYLDCRGFVLTLDGFTYIKYWNPTGECLLESDNSDWIVAICDEPGKNECAVAVENGRALIPCDRVRYIKTTLNEEAAERMANGLRVM